MEICIIAEGSYPYVSGGVSSWINQLASEMKDVKFKVLSIMPSREENLEYKYELHDNIIEIKTIYLNDYLYLNPLKKVKEPKLSNIEKIQVEKFLRFEKDVDWNIVLNAISNKKTFGDCVQFFKSKFFWELILSIYKDGYEGQEFNSFFWTLRSMFLTFINILQNDVPKADIYHCVSTGYAGLMGILAKIRYNKPLILTEHGVYAREREEEIIKAKWVTGIYKQFWIDFFYFISIGTYKTSDIVVSLFERNRQIQLELGSLEEKTRIIPNGVDIRRFSTKHEETSTFNVGAVLRIVPIKDVKTLIKAFKLVKDDIVNSKLYLMGPYDEDKVYYEECVRLIKNLRLEEDVIITGKVDVKEYVKKMNVLVLTSISEGQPLVILEGMSSGIPFVSTDVGSCKELLEGKEDDDIGPCGIITPPVSPRKTYKAIMKLFNDEDLRMKMRGNGRERVEKYYTKELFINSYKKIYRDLR